MYRLVVAAAVIAVPAAATASSDDLITRPLVLEPGAAIASVAVEINLAQRRFAIPVSIAPDLWLGLAPRWMIGLVHSNRSVDQVGARASLCFRGDALSCDRVYVGTGVDVWWSLREGAIAIAPRGRFVVRATDPVKPAITAGAVVRWTRGRFAITSDPYLRLGLANRDLGNRAKLMIPVWLGLQPTCRWLIELHTGWDGELATWRDGWHVPIALGLVARATGQLDVAVEAGFPHLLGPQADYKDRAMAVTVAYRHRAPRRPPPARRD